MNRNIRTGRACGIAAGFRRAGLPAGQKPPLTPEYQALFDKNTADQKAGGHGMEPSWKCLPPGMPRIMNVYEPMEIIITPATTYILISHIQDNRRIYTDGRDWPKEPVPTFQGYSIGKWLDTDGDGRYDTLETETRYMKGPRTYETNGLPLHLDNKTVVKEKMYADKDNPNLILNEITTIDNALTGPWTITKKYFRDRQAPAQLARGGVRGEQSARQHPERQLHAQRRRPADALPQGAEAAGFAVFQVRARTRLPTRHGRPLCRAAASYLPRTKVAEQGDSATGDAPLIVGSPTGPSRWRSVPARTRPG